MVQGLIRTFSAAVCKRVFKITGEICMRCVISTAFPPLRVIHFQVKVPKMSSVGRVWNFRQLNVALVDS